MSTRQADEEEYHVSARGPISIGNLLDQVIVSRKIRHQKVNKSDLVLEYVREGATKELRKFPVPKDKSVKAPRQIPARQAQPAMQTA